jgi:hypothetical protein
MNQVRLHQLEISSKTKDHLVSERDDWGHLYYMMQQQAK